MLGFRIFGIDAKFPKTANNDQARNALVKLQKRGFKYSKNGKPLKKYVEGCIRIQDMINFYDDY